MRPRVSRSSLAPAAVAPKVDRPRCGSCGVGIPKLNHRPFRCSYCVGDPYFGKDGYLLEMINEALAGELAPAKRIAMLACLSAKRSADRRGYMKQAFFQ